MRETEQRAARERNRYPAHDGALHSADYGKMRPLAGQNSSWSNYPRGVAWAIRENGFESGYFQAGFAGGVSPGAGLSCSAVECPDGWRDHQGGTTGYGSRKVVASPDTNLWIDTGQAFAWNPSLMGTKAEETYVLTAGGPELLSGM